MLLVKCFCSFKSFFVSVELHADHNTVTKLRQLWSPLVVWMLFNLRQWYRCGNILLAYVLIILVVWLYGITVHIGGSGRLWNSLSTFISSLTIMLHSVSHRPGGFGRCQSSDELFTAVQHCTLHGPSRLPPSGVSVSGIGDEEPSPGVQPGHPPGNSGHSLGVRLGAFVGQARARHAGSDPHQEHPVRCRAVRHSPALHVDTARLQQP